MFKAYKKFFVLLLFCFVILMISGCGENDDRIKARRDPDKGCCDV